MFMLMITGTLCLSSCGFFMPLGNKHYFIYIFMTFVIYFFRMILVTCWRIWVFAAEELFFYSSIFEYWSVHVRFSGLTITFKLCFKNRSQKNLDLLKAAQFKAKIFEVFFQWIIKVVKHPGYRCLFLLLHVADIKLLQAVICPSSYRADWNEPVTFYRRIL